LRPAQANSSREPISKNPSQKKKAGGVAQGVDPVQAPIPQKKKKKHTISEDTLLKANQIMEDGGLLTITTSLRPHCGEQIKAYENCTQAR
jgi:hypothetical protein